MVPSSCFSPRKHLMHFPLPSLSTFLHFTAETRAEKGEGELELETISAAPCAMDTEPEWGLHFSTGCQGEQEG